MKEGNQLANLPLRSIGMRSEDVFYTLDRNSQVIDHGEKLQSK